MKLNLGIATLPGVSKSKKGLPKFKIKKINLFFDATSQKRGFNQCFLFTSEGLLNFKDIFWVVENPWFSVIKCSVPISVDKTLFEKFQFFLFLKDKNSVNHRTEGDNNNNNNNNNGNNNNNEFEVAQSMTKLVESFLTNRDATQTNSKPKINSPMLIKLLKYEL